MFYGRIIAAIPLAPQVPWLAARVLVAVVHTHDRGDAAKIQDGQYHDQGFAGVEVNCIGRPFVIPTARQRCRAAAQRPPGDDDSDFQRHTMARRDDYGGVCVQEAPQAVLGVHQTSKRGEEGRCTLNRGDAARPHEGSGLRG